jgi:hypothetical protein
MKPFCILTVFFAFVFPFPLSAQNNDTVSSAERQPIIITPEKNYIENDAVLEGFFKSLSALQDEPGKKSSILHIGDSHIQGDYLSRTVRYRLQKEFGEAGRGLIFPYSLLNMYGPVDYSTTSNVKWENTRMFPRERKGPVGLTGYAIFTSSPLMKLQIKLYEPNKTFYGALHNFTAFPSNTFNKISILYSNDSLALPLRVSGVSEEDVSGEKVRLPQFNPTHVGFQQASVTLDGSYKRLLIEADTQRPFAAPVYIHGVSFENTKSSGILYNMAGVGACQLSNFMGTTYFFNQTVALKPNLIIISLGANESCNRNFDTVGYAGKLRQLLSDLRNSIPGVQFIITTPPDILYRRSRPPSMDPICRTLRSVAFSDNCGFWDLNRCMGGAWSNQYWYANKLAGPDRIHFSPKGYDFLGLLFTEAFLNSYHKYGTKNADTASIRQCTEPYRALFTGITTTSIRNAAPNNAISQERQNNPVSGKTYHTVKKGESVYSISRRYKTNHKTVQQLNGFTDRTIIRPGQRIRVR